MAYKTQKEKRAYKTGLFTGLKRRKKKKVEEEAEEYCKRVETKLDTILKLHGCELTDDAIIRPNGVTNEKPQEHT